MKKYLKKILEKIGRLLKYERICSTHFKTIKKMRAGGAYKSLTPSQVKEIQDYYLKYWGEKISLKWHEYYYYLNNEFSPRYMPTYIYYGKIIPILNNKRFGAIYSDKSLVGKWVGDRIKYPKTFVRNINGIFYVDDFVVTREVALTACLNLGDAVIKHSIDSSYGNNVLRFSSCKGIIMGKNCPNTIEQLFDVYKKDYLIQAAIQQHPEMEKLNPSSLNTIRVMTYWSKNGVVVLYAVVRIGRNGAIVDNASAGGLYCGVKEDGTLKDKAYTLAPYSVHTKTDTGVVLKDFKIPLYEDVKKSAIELHQQLPYSKFIGWDLSINKENEIELVEINANSPGLFQGATGPAFGDYTEEILEFCKDC